LVVTHAGAIKCLAWHLSGHRWSKADDIGAQDYRLHWLSAAEGRLSLEGLNAVALP
jgi:broad specificity phosphatase PhoE